jgi:hypothetical protein
MNIRDYGSFLAVLLAIGPKLQAIWPKIAALFAAAMDLEQAVAGILPASNAPAPTAPAAPLAPAAPATPATPPDGTLADTAEYSENEIAAMEREVVAHVAGPNAAFDASVFKKAWQFLSAHPEWINALGYVVSLVTHAP